MKVLISSYSIDIITRYLSAWVEDLIKNYFSQYEIIHLSEEQATQEMLEKSLTEKNLGYVFLNGHGNKNKICGNNNKTLINSENTRLLKGKKVHALSCQSAKGLGKSAMEKGTKCYIGYDEKFVLLSRNQKNPLEDTAASLFLDPAFIPPKLLVAGMTAEEAVKSAKSAYASSIQKVQTDKNYSDSEKDEIMKYLWWDHQHLISC